MHSADIRNGQRGHRSHDDPAAQVLSAEQAAPLLGCTVRHVRRLIASGDLAGHKDPYRTWRSALDAYRHRRQPREGELVAQQGADMKMSAGGQQHSGARDLQEDDDESTTLMVALAAELAGARDQIERLARENGRLEAELTQRRREASHRGGSPENGHRGGALARVGLWLRR